MLQLKLKKNVEMRKRKLTGLTTLK